MVELVQQACCLHCLLPNQAWGWVVTKDVTFHAWDSWVVKEVGKAGGGETPPKRAAGRRPRGGFPPEFGAGKVQARVPSRGSTRFREGGSGGAEGEKTQATKESFAISLLLRETLVLGHVRKT